MTWPTKDDFVNGDVLTAAQVNNIADNLNLFDPTSATNGQVPVANGAGSVAWATAASGLTIMKPTSTAVGSGTATINAGGSVTISAVGTSLSLNGVFTSAYRSYLIVLDMINSSGAYEISARLRAAGTDATGSNYSYQRITATATTVSAARTTSSQTKLTDATDATQRTGITISMYGPQLAAPTVGRTMGAIGYLNSYFEDYVFTHSLSTSYDGITFLGWTGTMTGQVTVYGLGQ